MVETPVGHGRATLVGYIVLVLSAQRVAPTQKPMIFPSNTGEAKISEVGGNGTIIVMNMTPKEEALFFFRRLVFAMYVEIGALQPHVHPELAKKADIKNSYFHGEKQKQAIDLFQLIETAEDPKKIIMPYRERTGLTLEDVRRAFVEGDWKNKFGGYNFGGPKWERIADITLEMQGLIEKEDWEAAQLLTYDIKKLKTNQGYLVNQFEWAERR